MAENVLFRSVFLVDKMKISGYNTDSVILNLIQPSSSRAS